MLNLGRHLFAGTSISVSTRAIDLVSSSTVIDMLGLLTMDWSKLWRWQRDPSTFDEADFRRLEVTGVRVFHPAIELERLEPYAAARAQLAGWKRLVAAHGCHLYWVDSFSDLIEETRRGKLGLLLGLQNSEHFRTVADVEAFFRLGQRLSQLTYDGVNRLGSGCRAPRDRGLTDFGAAVIAEMNRLGMAIDISHCGDRTSADAVQASERPVLATHANCRELAPAEPRNKPDRLIRLLAARGGVMGITLVRRFVGPGSPDLDRLLDHFDHVSRLVGAEHVGLGTDVALDAVDERTGRPRSIFDIRGLDLTLRVFQIADGLLARGWRESDVGLVLGGNFLRVLAEIWTVGEWSPLGAPEALRRDPFCPARRPPSLALAPAPELPGAGTPSGASPAIGRGPAGRSSRPPAGPPGR
jgi:membrane dipeptidase